MPSPHVSVRLVVLALLLSVLAAVPAVDAAAVLHSPDQRAILRIRSRYGNVFKYGTAVVVGRDLLVTAQHVLAEDVEVVLAGGPAEADPACRTQFAGLAVVRATLPPETPRYELSSRMPSVGEAVTIAGYPLGNWQVRGGKVTRRLKSATLSGRVVTAPLIALQPAMEYGASGSPILDRRGLVVGIAVASNQEGDYTVAFPPSTGLRPCRTVLPSN